ncbi:MAG: DUF6350 family protein, partial [Streptosporangiaceae bacterium]
GSPAAGPRSLLGTGTVAALAVTGTGLAVITLLVLIGFVAAPHAGFGLPAVLRTAAMLWLVGHHVGFTFRGAGRIGMLPLGLVVLPGVLLWRAGRWVARVGGVRRLRHVGLAALGLAIPYAVATGALAIASRSALASASLLQAIACGFLLAIAAGGLGAARALAPWPKLIRLLPHRPRAVVVAVAGSLAALATMGALVTGISLAIHLHEAASLQSSLAPGVVGTVLLLLLQLGYLPNAIVWAIAFTLGPGFAFGSATVVAPTGSALAQLPALPLLAALPPGLHSALPGGLEPVVLALPYLAGGLGGLLLVRAVSARGATRGTPAVTAGGATPGIPAVSARGATPGPPAGTGLPLDVAPLLGLVCGVVAGGVLGVLAAVSGGPLGDGRLAAVGPSPWQVGVVSALELGISTAVTAGLLNYLALRRAGALPRQPAPSRIDPTEGADGAHLIYLDPWAGDESSGQRKAPRGPADLP